MTLHTTLTALYAEIPLTYNFKEGFLEELHRRRVAGDTITSLAEELGLTGARIAEYLKEDCPACRTKAIYPRCMDKT